MMRKTTTITPASGRPVAARSRGCDRDRAERGDATPTSLATTSPVPDRDAGPPLADPLPSTLSA